MVGAVKVKCPHGRSEGWSPVVVILSVWMRGLNQRFAKPSVGEIWLAGSNPAADANASVAKWSNAPSCNLGPMVRGFESRRMLQTYALVAKPVDANDSKSFGSDVVLVRIRPGAPKLGISSMAEQTAVNRHMEVQFSHPQPIIVL